MVFIEYFILACMQVVAMIICYFTNPIVVLFADKYGNLPRIFKLWQTYDSTLDVEWMIGEEIVPKIFRYDFNKHYEYHADENGDGYMIPGYVNILDSNFTLKERVQRYFCRVCWLYRNCAYGFAYYLFGREYTPSATDTLVDIVDPPYYKFFLKGNDIFCLYYKKPWSKTRYLRVYAGWKIKSMKDYKNPNRAMLAFHINPFRKIETL